MELRPDEVISLNGGALTPSTLELIVQVANRNGKVAIINMGNSSILELGLDLIEMAKRAKMKERG